jgi:hypothetical protein
MSEVDEKLSLEVLKKLQQRLAQAEHMIAAYELQLKAFHDQHVEVLKDLRCIYQLLGRHQDRLTNAGLVAQEDALRPGRPH